MKNLKNKDLKNQDILAFLFQVSGLCQDILINFFLSCVFGSGLFPTWTIFTFVEDLMFMKLIGFFRISLDFYVDMIISLKFYILCSYGYSLRILCKSCLALIKTSANTKNQFIWKWRYMKNIFRWLSLTVFHTFSGYTWKRYVFPWFSRLYQPCKSEIMFIRHGILQYNHPDTLMLRRNPRSRSAAQTEFWVDCVQLRIHELSGKSSCYGRAQGLV